MNKAITSLIFSLYTISAFASWSSPIHNFHAGNSNAGRQNWDIIQAQNGWVYFANNEGVVEYNGIDWNIHKMENGSIVRALEASRGGIIYIGGQGEFGKLSPDEVGRLKYTNLKTQLPDDIKGDFKEVWDIHCTSSLVYFRFRHSILTMDRYGNFTATPSAGITQASCKMGENIYFATTSGLYVMGGGSPILIGSNDSPIPYGEICAMAAYDDSIIIATNFDGLFIYKDGRCTPLKTPVDGELRGNQLFSLAIENNKLVCGTVRNGLYIIDLESGHVENINIERGLGNNTILSAMFDTDGNLWCGLDNGIDMVELRSPLRHLAINQRYRFSGYCTLIHNKHIYLGSNQGVIRIDNNFQNPQSNGENAKMVKNSEGQVWKIQKIEDKIFCSHNRGLFILREHPTDPYLEPLYNHDGVWGITHIEGDKYLIGTYGGVAVMTLSRGKNPTTKRVEGYRGSVREAIYHAPSHSLFFITGDGLEVISFDSELNIHQTKLLIADAAYNIKMVEIADEIVIYTPEKTYVVDDKRQILPTTKYDQIITRGASYSMLQTHGRSLLWSVVDDRLVCSEISDENHNNTPRHQLIYDSNYFFIKGFTSVERVCDRYSIIGSIYGFSLVDLEHQRGGSDSPQPLITGIYDTSQRNTLLLSNAHGVKPTTLTLTHEQNSIRIVFGCNAIYDNLAEFSFRLRGSDNEEWGEWSKISVSGMAGGINQKEYTELFEGTYHFDVRLRDRFGAVQITTVEIRVLPPWQRSGVAYSLYTLFVLLLISLFGYHIVRYNRRHRHLAELDKIRVLDRHKRIFESKSIEQENRIIRLKNEKLESEVLAKSAELSNLMLNKLEKSDIVNEVKNELSKIKVDAFNSRQDVVIKRVNSLVKRLDDKLVDNIDWSAFEDNFDLANNNFSAKIKERFSWMNTNERKLCVYIKMGFQNKEIAPMLNLSVRGVEMLRYRVRKKMELERNESLYEFFQRM